MQRSIKPVHYPNNQLDDPQPASMARTIQNARKPTRETDELHTPSSERAPASAVNAILGRLGLARAESEPEAHEATLAHGLADHAWAVRVATVQKLGHIGEDAPLELLLVALRDAQASVRVAAARALSRNPRQAALHALVASMTDVEWIVRTEAARALGKLSNPEALAALLVATHDTDAAVRAAALLALSELGADEAIEPLNTALHDDDWSVREAATLALTQFAKPTVLLPPRLITPVQDPSALAPDETGSQSNNPSNITTAPPSASQPRLLQLAPLAITQINPTARISTYEHESTNAPHPITPRWDTRVEDQAQHQSELPSKQRGLTTSGRVTRKMRTFNLLASIVGCLLVSSICTWFILINWPNFSAGKQHISSHFPSAFTIYRGHTSSVEKLAWSPDGRAMASADNQGTVRIWQVDSGDTITKYTQAGKVLALRWSDASTLLVVYGIPNHNGLLVRQISLTTPFPNRIIFRSLNLPATPKVAAWSPNGSILAFDAGQNTLQLWLINSVVHQQLLTISNILPNRPVSQTAYAGLPQSTLPGALLNQLAWSPDGSQLATISQQGLLNIWNARTGANVATLPSEQQITSATWIACGPHSYGLIFAQAQSLLWDLLWKWCPEQQANASSVFLPAQVGRATPTASLTINSGLSVGTIAISPTTNQLLLATSDGLVQVRNASNGNLIDVYTGHSAQVNAIAWSPNGRSIATASADTTVQVWQEA